MHRNLGVTRKNTNTDQLLPKVLNFKNVSFVRYYLAKSVLGVNKPCWLFQSLFVTNQPQYFKLASYRNAFHVKLTLNEFTIIEEKNFIRDCRVGDSTQIGVGAKTSYSTSPNV